MREVVAVRWEDQFWILMLKTIPFGLNSDSRPLRKERGRTCNNPVTCICPGVCDQHQDRCVEPNSVTRVPLLRFVIDSQGMEISLQVGKWKSIWEASKRALPTASLLCLEMPQLLRMMVSAHPAVLPACLHYRYFKRVRT